MKRVVLKASLAGVLALTVACAFAKETSNEGKFSTSHASYKNESGNCVASLAAFDIQINNVRARILGGGDMWWDLNNNPKYEVPKGDPALHHPLCSIFAGAIWISGFDAGGNLKCAAQRYRDFGNDYWTGPLTNGNIDQVTCSQYDHHFSVLGADIGTAQTAFLSKGAQTSKADVPNDVLAWPAIGNPYLASDPTLIGATYNITSNLAPFYDYDGNGIYDPVKGDYPVIPTRNTQSTAFADQMVFWVMNDVGNIHTQSNGQAIGIQVNSLAFAFQSTNDLNNMTFYEYEITNQSTNKLFQTYVSQWVDPDLGCFANDRVGCDTTRKLGYCYNGSSPDNDCQTEYGYGTQLPQIGITFFEGPLSDSGIEIGLTSFVYFTNGAPSCCTDPSTAAQYRNYQTGFWNDGTPFTYGGTGYGGTTPTHFIFPGNPSNATEWSECQPAVALNLPAGDRRLVESSGPFTLKTGVSEYVTIGVPWVRPPGTGVGLCPDINSYLGPVADEAQALFNTGFKLLNGPDAPTVQIRELDKELIINLQNLPGSNNVGEAYSQVDGATEAAVQHYLQGHGDSTYKFQGYKLYQVANGTVAPSDLTDATKAQLIKQVDIQDSITTIINYIKQPGLGLVPTLEVSGTNTGIINSFDITTDAFASGTSNQLVNHNYYYFAAIAYAYNNYIPYDANNPTAGGQLLPYLQGRNNFKIYEAVPHISDSRNDGSIVNSKWGQGVQVNRIEGKNNGGNGLQLTPAAVEAILNSGTSYIDTLAYAPGGDPIGFQVTDPVNLREADFELRLVDTPGSKIGAGTRWMLHDLTNNDTIWSERNLDRPYQQQVVLNQAGSLTDLGFSIKLGTPAKVYTIPGKYLDTTTTPTYVYTVDTKQSSLVYGDSSNPWLTFVQNGGPQTVTNWVRSGTTLAPMQSGNPPANNAAYLAWDSHWYGTFLTNPSNMSAFTDSNNVFNNILNGSWAPYCLAANYSYPHRQAPYVQYVYGPGFKWYNLGPASQIPPMNTLDRVASVDVIITPDKSKWSRCVVLETGEDPAYNQGGDIAPRTFNTYLTGTGACKGQIRMAYSRDWNNPANRDYLVSQTPTSAGGADTGRSWFPGYAINVETGERLNIAFGEASSLDQQNGSDMLWNPTSTEFDPVVQPNANVPQIPFFGGRQFIYVMDTKYDGCQAVHDLLIRTYDSLKFQSSNLQEVVPKSLYPYYESLMWASIPILGEGYTMNGDGTGNPAYIPPSEVTVHLRVQKPYVRMQTVATTGNDSMPRYQFSTKGLGITQNNQPVAKSALDLIKIVPNPYLAYSAYETDQNSSTVYVTNLPNTCTVSIYSLDGKIIRVLHRAIGVNPTTSQLVETTDGTAVGNTLIENTISWDLKNQAGIMVASGVYLFRIEAPGIGEKTLKWFGVVRPADTSNY